MRKKIAYSGIKRITWDFSVFEVKEVLVRDMKEPFPLNTLIEFKENDDGEVTGVSVVYEYEEEEKEK